MQVKWNQEGWAENDLIHVVACSRLHQIIRMVAAIVHAYTCTYLSISTIICWTLDTLGDRMWWRGWYNIARQPLSSSYHHRFNNIIGSTTTGVSDRVRVFRMHTYNGNSSRESDKQTELGCYHRHDFFRNCNFESKHKLMHTKYTIRVRAWLYVFYTQEYIETLSHKKRCVYVYI